MKTSQQTESALPVFRQRWHDKHCTFGPQTAFEDKKKVHFVETCLTFVSKQLFAEAFPHFTANSVKYSTEACSSWRCSLFTVIILFSQNDLLMLHFLFRMSHVSFKTRSTRLHWDLLVRVNGALIPLKSFLKSLWRVTATASDLNQCF